MADVAAVTACLSAHYGPDLAAVGSLPGGFDPAATAYRVTTRDGAAYFLKVRSGPVREAGLLVARTLRDLGIRNVLAPLPTRSSALWCSLDGAAGASAVLYPFVRGETAMAAGMSPVQWREFGAMLRAVHGSGLGAPVRDRLSVAQFSLPSAAPLGRLLASADGPRVEGAATARLAAVWRVRAERLRRVLTRAEELGARLRARSFELVPCHADAHLANILVGADGRIWLVDWDDARLAPRERDLLFVVGSRIAGVVVPADEASFFAGYGPVEVAREALIYFRYERIVEDVGGWPSGSCGIRSSTSPHGRSWPNWWWATWPRAVRSTAPRRSSSTGSRPRPPDPAKPPAAGTPRRGIRHPGQQCPPRRDAVDVGGQHRRQGGLGSVWETPDNLRLSGARLAQASPVLSRAPAPHRGARQPARRSRTKIVRSPGRA
jgi:spectinomycin phosphotransferase